MEKGEAGSAINQPFAALLDALDNWPECVGYVINPYSDKLLVDHGIRDMIVGFEPKSYVSFVKGSVLDMKVDAVVNSAHRTLLEAGRWMRYFLPRRTEDMWRKHSSAAEG